MGRKGITYEDVAEASKQLVACGQNPTADSVRIIIGTGSKSTIAQHLRTFRNYHEQAQTTKELSEKLPEELIGLIKGLWQRMRADATDQINEIKQSCTLELDERNFLICDLENQCSLLTEQFVREKHLKENEILEKTVLEQAIRKHEIDNLTLTLAQEKLQQQLTYKQERIEELHQLNEQVQANLEHYREASREQRLQDMNRFEQTQMQLEQVIMQLRQEVSLLTQQKIKLQTQCEQLDLTYQDLKSEEQKLAVLYNSTKTELIVAQKDSSNKTQMAEHWQLQYQMAQTKSEEQNVKLTDLQTQIALLTAKCHVQHTKINELHEQKKEMELANYSIDQERVQLLEQLKLYQKVNLNSKAEAS